MRADRNLRRSPMRTAAETYRTDFNAASIGAGAMFLPYALMRISFLRSVIARKPSASKEPTSAVRNHPSSSKTGAVSSACRQHPPSLIFGPFARTCAGEDGARPREPVPAVHLDAGAKKERRDVAGKRRAARDRETEAPSEAGLDLPENEPVGERVLQPQDEAGRLPLSEHREAAGSRLHAPGEERTTQRRSLVDGGLDARQHLLVP